MFALFFSRAVLPEGKVVSFEPNPVYKAFQKKLEVKNFTNVQTFNIAIGSSDYKGHLICDKTYTGKGSLNTGISNNFLHNKTINKVEVDVRSIDSICSNNQNPVPGFVKIDVEGFEFDVLQGMEDILKNKNPELNIEMHGATLKNKETNIIKIVRLLKIHNYRIKHIETDEIITTENSFIAREEHIFCC